jgi:hypothetical protein
VNEDNDKEGPKQMSLSSKLNQLVPNTARQEKNDSETVKAQPVIGE